MTFHITYPDQPWHNS